MNRLSPNRIRQQQGMALLIALIVLVVVSILGTVAMRTALFQSRVSINSQAENLAFQAAESGLDAAVAIARRQITGPDGISDTGDGEILPANAQNLFNKALNEGPQRICVTEEALPNPTLPLTAPNVYGDGVYNEDGSPGFETACPELPSSNTRVTTVVGEAPPDSYSAAAETFDLKYGGSLIQVQVRAYGDIPDTNVTSVHAEEWGMLGPSDSEGG